MISLRDIVFLLCATLSIFLSSLLPYYNMSAMLKSCVTVCAVFIILYISAYIFTTLQPGASMEKKPVIPMTPFDELVTSPQLQAIKLLLPYAPVSEQRLLASFIKFQEFRQTIRSGRRSVCSAGSAGGLEHSFFRMGHGRRRRKS